MSDSEVGQPEETTVDRAAEDGSLNDSPANAASRVTDVDAEGDDDAGDEDSGDDGDIGADYIEAFLDLADLDGDIEIDFRNSRSYITVSAPEESSLSKIAFPDAVSALQDLARLAIEAKTGTYSRLIVDVSGSRDARTEELKRLVDHAIEKIEQGASSAALPPMTSYDRKLVHDFVAERGYQSDSVGEGDQRYPVIGKR